MMERARGKTTYRFLLNKKEDSLRLFFLDIKNAMTKKNRIIDGFFHGIWELVLVSGNLSYYEKKTLFLLILLIYIIEENGSTKLVISPTQQLKSLLKTEFNFDELKSHFSSVTKLTQDIVTSIKTDKFSTIIGTPPKNLFEEIYAKDEPVEVYCNDHNWDSQADSEYDKWYAGRRERITKVAECIPYEDSDTIDYDDPNWEESSFEWKIEEVA